MEQEARNWIDEFPVPLMVSASDGTEDLLDVTSAARGNHLVVWTEPNGQIILDWQLPDDASLPDTAQDLALLASIFDGYPVRTASQVRAQARSWTKDQQATIRNGRLIILFWAILLPASLAILGFASRLIGFAVLIFSLLKAVQRLLAMYGRLKPLHRNSLESKKRVQRLEYYAYLCEQNPEAFDRLVNDNFKREARERVRSERAALMHAAKQDGGASRT